MRSYGWGVQYCSIDVHRCTQMYPRIHTDVERLISDCVAAALSSLLKHFQPLIAAYFQGYSLHEDLPWVPRKDGGMLKEHVKYLLKYSTATARAYAVWR